MGKRMKILALDSSGLVASVAVVEEDQLLAEYTVNYKKTHSQTLLPMLDEIAKMIELDLETIDAIAVAAGPGSFTGLRIGSATAKGLGLALKKPLIPVPTVDALAYNLYDTTGASFSCTICFFPTTEKSIRRSVPAYIPCACTPVTPRSRSSRILRDTSS